MAAIHRQFYQAHGILLQGGNSAQVRLQDVLVVKRRVIVITTAPISLLIVVRTVTAEARMRSDWLGVPVKCRLEYLHMLYVLLVARLLPHGTVRFVKILLTAH